MIDPTLDTKEAVQVNPVGPSSAIGSSNAVLPCCSESGAFDCAQKIDAVRCHAQLEDLLNGIWIQEVWTAEFGERRIGSFDIVTPRINPNVHVLCVAWFGMIDEGEAADNQVPDTVLTKHQQQVFKILDGLHRF